MEKVSAASSSQGIDYVNLISYSEYLLDVHRNVLYGRSVGNPWKQRSGYDCSNKGDPLKVGDIIEIAGQEA